MGPRDMNLFIPNHFQSNLVISFPVLLGHQSNNCVEMVNVYQCNAQKYLFKSYLVIQATIALVNVYPCNAQKTYLAIQATIVSISALFPFIFQLPPTKNLLG